MEVLNKYLKAKKQKSCEEMKENTVRVSNLELNERGLHTYYPVEDLNISSEDEEMEAHHDGTTSIQELGSWT